MTVVRSNFRVQWRLLGRWLFKEPWHVWVGSASILAVLGAVIVVSLLSGRAAIPFAVGGGVLNFLGLVTVALGLSDTRRVFGREGFRSTIRSWWGRRPSFFWKSKAVNLQGTMHMGLRPGAKMNFIVGPNPALPLPQRVAFLEYAYTKHEKRLHDLNDELSKHASELHYNITDTNTTREAEDKKLRELIEETAIGGIHLEIMGLMWLLTGTLMAILAAVL